MPPTTNWPHVFGVVSFGRLIVVFGQVADALVIVSKSAAPAEDAPTLGLSEEQRAMLKAAYADIDTNKSGTIEVAEFKSVPGNKQLKGHYFKNTIIQHQRNTF